MRSTLLAIALAATTAAEVGTAAEAAPARAPSRKRLPVVAGLGSAAVLGAVPAVRRSASGLVKRLLNHDDPLAGLKPDDAAPSRPSEADGGATTRGPAGGDAAAGSTAVRGEQFQLTPDRLSSIADMNPQLEEIASDLASVPVFTAAVGNGTSPLTVPAEDGKKVSHIRGR